MTNQLPLALPSPSPATDEDAIGARSPPSSTALVAPTAPMAPLRQPRWARRPAWSVPQKTAARAPQPLEALPPELLDGVLLLRCGERACPTALKTPSDQPLDVVLALLRGAGWAVVTSGDAAGAAVPRCSRHALTSAASVPTAPPLAAASLLHRCCGMGCTRSLRRTVEQPPWVVPFINEAPSHRDGALAQCTEGLREIVFRDEGWLLLPRTDVGLAPHCPHCAGVALRRAAKSGPAAKRAAAAAQLAALRALRVFF